MRDLLIHFRESYFVEFELVNRAEQVDDEDDVQHHPSRQKSAASSMRSFRVKGQHRSESHTTYQTIRTIATSEL